MNSHTKPRHENKPDLIYLLPVSRQMPGRAGSTAGRGGTGNHWGRILAWEDQEGSIPLVPCASPCQSSPARTQQPHGMSPRAPPVLGCTGWGWWGRAARTQAHCPTAQRILAGTGGFAPVIICILRWDWCDPPHWQHRSYWDDSPFGSGNCMLQPGG